MDSPIGPPRFRGLKITLVAGLALLTTDALFAQSADQNDVNALKSQMNQMQKQYEQRIEAMEAKMKALEVGTTGSILNTRVLTDADGKAAPTPMLDESFLKTLTRNFSLAVYMRAGVSFNGSGGAQGKITFVMPDNYVGGGRTTSRLGNEDDFYTEIAFNQAHVLGDSPDVMDVTFTEQLQAFSSPVKTNAVNVKTGGGVAGFGIGLNQMFVEMKNVIRCAPEITFWAGDRFYDRWNIDSEDYFWLNTSGFGIGVYNIHIGDCPGTLWLAWLGNNNDNINEATTISTFNAVNSRVGDLYKQTWDVRYKDIPFLCGKLSFVAIGNYIKGDTYESSFPVFGGTAGGVTFGTSVPGIIQTHDMWGIGGGAIWEYDFGN